MRNFTALSAFFLALFSLAACAPQTHEEAPQAAWHRQDLWMLDPEVLAKPDQVGARKAWGRAVVYLGAEEVRDMTQVAAYQRKQIPRLAASQVRALQQVAGSVLRYHLELGDEPYLSFTPLVDLRHPWPTRFKISANRPGAEPRLLYDEWVAIGVPPAQATVTVDLGQFADGPVELLLDATMDPEGFDRRRSRRAQWASPAIYFRGPLASPDAADKHKDRGPRPNILILGADTLRADHLGAYGANPSITPALDQLASESDVWLDAVSSFNVTNPSFVSLMTGLYGKNHGIYDLKTPLPEEFTTLAELFSADGYATQAVISARHLQDKNSGLGQGFDDVTVSSHHFAAELVIDMGIDWIAEHSAGDQPFFAWFHFFDPHTPHTPPAPYALGFNADRPYGLEPVEHWNLFRTPGWPGYSYMPLGGSSELYQGEVAYLDRQIDRLLGFLRSRNLLDSTLIVFVADHGENLAEHGVRYGHHGLFDTTTLVPLMIRWPGSGSSSSSSSTGGRRLTGLAQNVDIFPTLLGAAGLELPEVDGVDLKAAADSGERVRRAAFSEHSHLQGTRIRTADYSYMISAGSNFVTDGRYLFDLSADPGEENNLAGTGLAVEEELHRALQGWLSTRRESAGALPVDLTQEDIDRLRALGYL